MTLRRRASDRIALTDRIALKLRELAVLSPGDMVALELILDDALRHRRAIAAQARPWRHPILTKTPKAS